MTVITRFAPSPTGFLHIGGARTALFNWLYSKHHNGKFLLRIEDTDQKRSTQEAIDAILNGLKWMGLDWDDDAVFQSKQQARHVEIANMLLESGNAYHCYCTPEELQSMRAEAEAKGESFRYNRKWRDTDLTPPAGVKPAVRLKAPIEGSTVIEDAIQGRIEVPNNDLDDMIIVRSDGTPTYMLAVVVDDFDMGVTDIIRGDDHLTNSFRQQQIYNACGWDAPKFAHLPLIHGQDGKKLSKRHGALGVEAYRDMGYMPEGLRNYLLRLGWSHGDDEIIPTNKAIEWFTLDNVGRSPARFDTKKLESLNGHYIKESDNKALTELVSPFIETHIDRAPTAKELSYITNGMDGLKERAKTLIELADKASLYIQPDDMDEKAKDTLEKGRNLISSAVELINSASDISHQHTFAMFKEKAEELNIKVGELVAPVRVALTGRTAAPSIFEMMEVLGKEESLARIERVL